MPESKEGKVKNKTKKSSSNRAIVVFITILVVIIIIAGVYKIIATKQDKSQIIDEQTSTQGEHQGQYNDGLVVIQEKIDRQQKVIDDLNNELEPLLEQRTELEEQMLNITTNLEAEEQQTSEETSQ